MRALLLVLAIVLASACRSIPSGSTQRRAGVLEFLYPEGKPASEPQDVRLTLPLRVGIAFAPETSTVKRVSALDEARRQELLERIANAFRGVEDVQRIEVISTSYLRPGGGFENLDQLKSMYGIDVIALLSYEQSQFEDYNAASLAYWTLVAAYFVEGNANSTHTFIDTSVFDITSRALLFNAAGKSAIENTSTELAAAEALRADSIAGFEQAVDAMIGQLEATLDRFRETAKSGTVRGPGTPALETGRVDEQGTFHPTGAGAVSPLELLAAIALACGLLVRRRSA